MAKKLLDLNEIVTAPNHKQYKIMEVLGEGGYGSVYKAVDLSQQNSELAFKAEKINRSLLRHEIKVLEEAGKRRCKRICRIIDQGQIEGRFRFLVMTLLGPDLGRLRSAQLQRKFSVGTVVRVAQQTLSAIEELHDCGYLSRDVKPGNFAVGIKEGSQHRSIFIFDFGLARNYLDNNRNHMPSRGEVGFRGTARYASLHAHLLQDLSRRDDVESWLYMTVELTKGGLPWRQVNDRDVVMAAKNVARTSMRHLFFDSCPAIYDRFLTLVDGLSFVSPPPYGTIISMLEELQKSHHIMESAPFDWEQQQEKDETAIMDVRQGESVGFGTPQKSPTKAGESHETASVGHEKDSRGANNPPLPGQKIAVVGAGKVTCGKIGNSKDGYNPSGQEQKLVGNPNAQQPDHANKPGIAEKF